MYELTNMMTATGPVKAQMRPPFVDSQQLRIDQKKHSMLS